MLIAILVIWALVGFTVWFGTRYQVWYDDHAVYMKSAGWGGELSIPFAEVSKISENPASVSEMAEGRHPLRRVIVFGPRATAPIYISTRHFAQEDINLLVEMVVDRQSNVALDQQILHRIRKHRQPPPNGS